MVDVNLFAQVDFSRMRRLHFAYQTQKSQHTSRILVNHFRRKFIFLFYWHHIFRRSNHVGEIIGHSNYFYIFLIIFNQNYNNDDNYVTINNQSWQKKRREKERKSHFPMFFRSSQFTYEYSFLILPLCSIISYFKRRIYNFICILATRHKTINQISIIVSRISHSLLHLRSTKLNNCNSQLRSQSYTKV